MERGLKPDPREAVDPAVVVGVAVGGHLLAGLAHGWFHLSIPVALPARQYAVAATFVFAGPACGLLVLAAGRRRLGGLLVAATLTVAFGFELLAHFAVENPDHVSTVVDGRRAFESTAWGAVATDAVGALAGYRCWRSAEAP